MGRTRWWRRSDHNTTEEQLAHLRQQVGAAEAELIEREAELVDLRAESFAFQLEYDTRVGRKAAELEEVEAEIKRCRQRISQYRQWGAGSPSQSGIPAGYVPVEEQYRRIWQQPRKPPPPPPAEPVDEATEAQIKTLYRQLCRRFHPDLVQDPVEQAWRTEMMTAVNAAYGARSLVELQALAETPDRLPLVEAGTDEQRLAALRDKLQQIQRRLWEVEQELRELTNSQMIELSLEVKLAQRQGRDLLAEMAADVEEDLARKRVVLDSLVAELEQLRTRRV
ncbi:MAG: J domain-containing protein [Anaerolineae bacterium]